jgi:hypothetical protein
VCVCVLRILITKDQILPFSNYNVRIYNILKKIRCTPETYWRHTDCGTLCYRIGKSCLVAWMDGWINRLVHKNAWAEFNNIKRASVERYSSLNVFDDGAVLLRSIIWTLSVVLQCFLTTTFQGMVLPSSSGETYSVGPGRSS